MIATVRQRLPVIPPRIIPPRRFGFSGRAVSPVARLPPGKPALSASRHGPPAIIGEIARTVLTANVARSRGLGTILREVPGISRVL
jgi:hypothetical protein